MSEEERLNFLRAIHGDNIPEDITEEILPCGSVIYTVGKPDIKKIIRMVLALKS